MTGGNWSAWFLADGGVGIDGLTERLLKLANRRPVETNDVFDTGQMADEDAVGIIELDPREITSILHRIHGRYVAGRSPCGHPRGRVL